MAEFSRPKRAILNPKLRPMTLQIWAYCYNFPKYWSKKGDFLNFINEVELIVLTKHIIFARISLRHKWRGWTLIGLLFVKWNHPSSSNIRIDKIKYCSFFHNVLHNSFFCLIFAAKINSNMATYTIKLDERTNSGKALKEYLRSPKGLEDIKNGRTMNIKDVNNIWESIL